MLKSIPKSNINRNSFKVYKSWEVSNADYQITSASLTQNKSQYKSIKSKYYNTDTFGNIFTTFGSVDNLGTMERERQISDTIRIISLPQTKYGEGIKKHSFDFTDNDTGTRYVDDGSGNITSDTNQYTIVLLDFETGDFTLEDGDGDQFEGTIISLDLPTSTMVATFGTDTDSFTILSIDLSTGVVTTSVPLDFDNVPIDRGIYGNIFYSDGLVVFTDTISPDYSLKYKSTKTIYETEVLLSAKAGEFNYSQNSTAVDVTLSGSYDFTTTDVTNGYNGGTIKIKEVQDIKRKNSYSGSIGSITGSWDDYHTKFATDPTGSYLTTYVSTIGLYDDNLNLVAVAKLPQPIKKLPDYDLNFIVRLDT